MPTLWIITDSICASVFISCLCLSLKKNITTVSAAEMNTGVEFIGNHVGRPAFAVSPEACQHMCRTVNNCTAWTYYTAKTTLYDVGTCNTLVLVLAAFENPAAVSAFKTGEWPANPIVEGRHAINSNSSISR